MNTQIYPKIELHLHLDCSLSYEVVHTIDPSISRETYLQDFVAPAKCLDLMDCIARASSAIALMQAAENLRLVVHDLFDQLRRDHVIYAEIRFAPLLHLEQGLSPEEVVSIVEAATAEASAATGVEAGVILCTLRHYTSEQSMQTVQLVERFRGTHVVAFDIAGDEAGFPLDAHIPAFHYAAQHGIPRTAHAGEASGANSVRETLKHLRPSRIGHGVRSSEDRALLDLLRAERIHLEVCPTSNIQTNTYATYPDHTIDFLYNKGISLSVSTDMRTVTPITLSQEYEQLHQHFSWNKGYFLHCNLEALHAAFLPEEKKKELEQHLRQEFAAYE